MSLDWVNAASGLLGGGSGGDMSSAFASQSTGIFQVGDGNDATQAETIVPANSVYPSTPPSSVAAPKVINEKLIIAGMAGLGALFILYYITKK